MNIIHTAVIMAAGLGTRFGQMTEKMPKGFVPFNGEPMVLHSIKTLIECGINRIVIGTGYKKESYEELKKIYPQIECVFSPRYAETNSMYTLYNCREAIGDDDFILLESDLVFEKKAISSLQDCFYDSAMLITPVTKFQDQYYVEMDDNNVLVNCSTDKEQIKPNGELVGIHKLSNQFYKKMCTEYEKIVEEKPKLGYEYQLLYMSQHIMPMNVLKVNDLQWYEIDDIDDLHYAEDNIKID
jgi:2-aminoethylphosphonate-pyruvate transaminase